jgi:hypothetical protein
MDAIFSRKGDTEPSANPRSSGGNVGGSWIRALPTQ